jgi:hypothetical protein
MQKSSVRRTLRTIRREYSQEISNIEKLIKDAIKEGKDHIEYTTPDFLTKKNYTHGGEYQDYGVIAKIKYYFYKHDYTVNNQSGYNDFRIVISW